MLVTSDKQSLLGVCFNLEEYMIANKNRLAYIVKNKSNFNKYEPLCIYQSSPPWFTNHTNKQCVICFSRGCSLHRFQPCGWKLSGAYRMKSVYWLHVNKFIIFTGINYGANYLQPDFSSGCVLREGMVIYDYMYLSHYPMI